MTITGTPQFSEPTPTVPLDQLAVVLCRNLERQREMLLSWVDELERLLDKEPRTAQLRQFWRNEGKPKL